MAKNIDWIIAAAISVDEMKETWAQNIDLSLFYYFPFNSQVSAETVEVGFCT